MTFARYPLAILVAGAGLIIGSSTTEAASNHHIDAYALGIQRQANGLMSELKYHYRHAPQFSHLMADARQVARNAAHVHEVAHYDRDLQHLQADLRELDSAIHHLDELMREVEYHVRHCRNRRCGHFHGDTRSARRLVDQMIGSLHHLQDDVRRELAVRRGNHRNGHRVYGQSGYGQNGHGQYGIKRGVNYNLGYRSNQNASYQGRSNSLTYSNRGLTIRLGSRH
ncbi:MAG: hypothetical protein WBF93_03295 [Pirellulales bacterium]